MSAPELHEGDWLDVVDGDGIWNVAQVLRLPSADSVEVTYDCWGDEYDEELPRDSNRIAPFHTHTWAVKCWAKLDTWPWWPALLTVRAPGSGRGSQNLRLEERLLVDFLDKADFTERSRCWVKKSKVVPFQSDEEARKRLTQRKKGKRKVKGEAHAKNLALSTTLLATCDAREDFPQFVEGTLPVKFEHNFTPPTEQVRKEMGEQVWLRGFADNRTKHAATHAYTSVLGGGEKTNEGDSAEIPTPTEEKRMRKAVTDDQTQTPAQDTAIPTPTEKKRSSKTATGDGTQIPAQETVVHDTDKSSASDQAKSAQDSVADPMTRKNMTRSPKTRRKRPRLFDHHDKSDRTDTSRASSSISPREQTQCDGEVEQQAVTDEYFEEKIASNTANASKEVRIVPRKYGKTPKMIKTPRRATGNLQSYTPPYARILLRLKFRNEQYTTPAFHTSSVRHTTKSLPCAKKGTANEKLPDADQQVQQPRVHVRSDSSDAKSDDGPASQMKNLARMTKFTVKTEKKLHTMENALEEKLTELAEKAVKAEKFRTKYAALPIMRSSPAFGSPQRENREDSQRENASNNTPDASQMPTLQRRYNTTDASRVPTLGRRSSQTKCGIRGLNEKISKYKGLSAATTRTELDAIKADLLNSAEVQAAISRIQNPSYGWTPSTAKAFGMDSPSLSSESSRCAFEKAKSRYAKQLMAVGSSDAKPSPRSPSRQFGQSSGYERDHSPEFPRPNYSNFGFSVNDNFSMNQWYGDLYPRAFNFQ